jgi:hypothetical protein
MAYAPSTPVTGSAQTGLTAPTYTLTLDLAPNNLGKQYAISALGGTQTGVEVNGVSKPFTVNFVRPASFKLVAKPDPVTGVLTRTSQNVWKLITRKGVVPLSGQSPQVLLITTTFEVPAGSDAVEPEDIRAACSLHFGILSQQSAGIGDSLITGTV